MKLLILLIILACVATYILTGNYTIRTDDEVYTCRSIEITGEYLTLIDCDGYIDDIEVSTHGTTIEVAMD